MGWFRRGREVITCCRNCLKREIGCHGRCEEYQRQREARAEELAESEQYQACLNNGYLTAARKQYYRRAAYNKRRGRK